MRNWCRHTCYSGNIWNHEMKIEAVEWMHCSSKIKQTGAGSMLLMMIAHPLPFGACRECSQKHPSRQCPMKRGTAMNKSKHGTLYLYPNGKRGIGMRERKRNHINIHHYFRMWHSIYNSSATHGSSSSLYRNSLKEEKGIHWKQKRKKDKKKGGNLKKKDIFCARENQSYPHTFSEPATGFSRRDGESMLLR